MMESMCEAVDDVGVGIRLDQPGLEFVNGLLPFRSLCRVPTL